MGNETTNLTTLVGNAIANDTVFNWNKQWTGGFRLAAETRKVRMLKVTVVLLADDDGTHATGEVTPGGKVVPVTPWLRNPAIHTKSGESYIDDLISLTNKQLFASGANFLLDRVNANYIFEKSTVVNNLTFTAGGNDAVAFIEKKRKEIGGEAWRDSVLLLFPWGKFGDATRSLPEGQGFSGSNWPFVKLAVWGYNRDRFVDGELVAGNVHLSHELGHFLGLDHTFQEGLVGFVEGGILDPNLNPLGLPLTEANLPQFNGLVKADIATRQAQMKDWIARWAHSFERDSGSSDPLFPKELAIKDTPVDLGMGLPAVMGNPIGSGKQDYKLDHFADLRVRKGADFGQPVGDGQPTTLDVHYSDDIRLNLMSYWYSQQYAMRYSKNQVARMQHAVDTFRSNLVLRTTTVTVTVHDDHLEVTESLFAKPPLLRLEPERVMIQIRKPTRRQIDTSIARFRRQRRAVHVGHCALTIPAR